MSKFLIKGGKKISGKIKVSGSKNAILALLPASLLVEGRVVFKNVPFIKDVESMISVLRYLGAEVFFDNSNLIINTKNLEYKDLLIEEVKALRASILFLGPVLFKFGKIKIWMPGGDVIGARPIDSHLKGLSDLGAKFNISDSLIEGKFKSFLSDNVILKEISVTASETLIMSACFSKKPINLRLIALEPHVQSLCRFLKKIGYEISGIGTHFLKIYKGRSLKKEVIFEVPFDYVEAATFLSLAPIVKDKLIIENAPIEDLDSVLIVSKEMNINLEVKNNSFILKKSNLKGTKIQTGIFPKFPSDAHPPFAVLATQATGVSLIHEWLYENRFGYLKEIEHMGANVEILDPHRAIIIGPTHLLGKDVRSLDIRAGIAVLLAGLMAEGETLIREIEKIERGYEKIDERLNILGAEIKKLD